MISPVKRVQHVDAALHRHLGIVPMDLWVVNDATRRSGSGMGNFSGRPRVSPSVRLIPLSLIGSGDSLKLSYILKDCEAHVLSELNVDLPLFGSPRSKLHSPNNMFFAEPEKLVPDHDISRVLYNSALLLLKSEPITRDFVLPKSGGDPNLAHVLKKRELHPT